MDSESTRYNVHNIPGTRYKLVPCGTRTVVTGTTAAVRQYYSSTYMLVQQSSTAATDYVLQQYITCWYNRVVLQQSYMLVVLLLLYDYYILLFVSRVLLLIEGRGTIILSCTPLPLYLRTDEYSGTLVCMIRRGRMDTISNEHDSYSRVRFTCGQINNAPHASILLLLLQLLQHHGRPEMGMQHAACSMQHTIQQHVCIVSLLMRPEVMMRCRYCLRV